jgi:hypothetical protein
MKANKRIASRQLQRMLRANPRLLDRITPPVSAEPLPSVSAPIAVSVESRPIAPATAEPVMFTEPDIWSVRRSYAAAQGLLSGLRGDQIFEF